MRYGSRLPVRCRIDTASLFFAVFRLTPRWMRFTLCRLESSPFQASLVFAVFRHTPEHVLR